MHVENDSFFLSVDKCHSHAYHVILYATRTIFLLRMSMCPKYCENRVSHTWHVNSQSSFLALWYTTSPKLMVFYNTHALLHYIIYTIILLKSVEVSKLQVAILARSSRKMSQTVCIVWKPKFASQFGLAIFYTRKTQKLGKPDRPRVCLFEWSSDAHCRERNGPSRLGAIAQR